MGECHWSGLARSVTALMARENVEVAVSPRVVSGDALKDDVSGGEKELKVSKAGRHLGTSIWPQGYLQGRPGHHVLPVGPKHSEDPRLICDLLGHLGRKGTLRTPQQVLS